MTQPTGADAPPEPPAMDGRVLSLSDGVFAFALTLMVLTVAVPTPATVALADLPAAVRRQWPEFFSYAISFWVVAVFWFAHRRLFRLVVADDTPSGWLNAAFLFAVAFLPYPTDMLGNYGAGGFALAFYDGSMLVTSLTLTALAEWITAHPRLTGGPLSPQMRRYQRLRSITTAGPFLLSLLLVPVSVSAARLCLLLVAIGHMGVQRAAPARRHRIAAPS